METSTNSFSNSSLKVRVTSSGATASSAPSAGSLEVRLACPAAPEMGTNNSSAAPNKAVSKRMFPGYAATSIVHLRVA